MTNRKPTHRGTRRTPTRKSTAAAPRRVRRPAPARGRTARSAIPVSALNIPAILLEGDPLPAPPALEPQPAIPALPAPPSPAPATREAVPAEALQIPEASKGGDEHGRTAEAMRAAAPTEPAGRSSKAETPLLVSGSPAPESGGPTAAIAELAAAPAIESAPLLAESSLGSVAASAPQEDMAGASSARLWLTPRDPHSLLAAWDLPASLWTRTSEWYLRVYELAPEERLAAELALPADAAHRFVFVGRGDALFRAELGHYGEAGAWWSLAESEPARTPPDTAAEEASEVRLRTVAPQLETVAAEVPPPRLPTAPAEPSRDALRPSAIAVSPAPPVPDVAPPMEAVGPTPAPVQRELSLPAPSFLPLSPLAVPADGSAPPMSGEGPVTQTRESAPAEARLPGPPSEHPPIPGPARAGERQPPQRWFSSLEWAQPTPGAGPSAGPPTGPIGGVSSPGGGPPGAPKDYWLVAEVELVVYGATEPGSRVTMAGEELPLRPDGSFSCRLALPPGSHFLPIEATSPDGSQTRQARFRIVRD